MTRDREYYATLRTEDADTGAVVELELTVTCGTKQQATRAFMELLARVGSFTEEDLDGQILTIGPDEGKAWGPAEVSRFVAGRHK